MIISALLRYGGKATFATCIHRGGTREHSLECTDHGSALSFVVQHNPTTGQVQTENVFNWPDRHRDEYHDSFLDTSRIAASEV